MLLSACSGKEKISFVKGEFNQIHSAFERHPSGVEAQLQTRQWWRFRPRSQTRRREWRQTYGWPPGRAAAGSRCCRRAYGNLPCSLYFYSCFRMAVRASKKSPYWQVNSVFLTDYQWVTNNVVEKWYAKLVNKLLPNCINLHMQKHRWSLLELALAQEIDVLKATDYYSNRGLFISVHSVWYIYYIGLYYTAFCDSLFLLTRCLFVTESRFS